MHSRRIGDRIFGGIRMKKTFLIMIAAVMAIVLCVSASAATNSNHLIDEGFPRFNDSEEKEWELFGWTVVDTEITAMGYKLDGGEIVWVDETVDSRENAKNLDKNDCFEDAELSRAVVEMSLTNGLEEFFAYRIHITLDGSKIAKGAHALEVQVKYKDGSIGNPFRESTINFEKTLDAEAGGEATQAPDSDTKAEDPVTDAETEAEQKPVENPKTADTAIAAIAAVAAIALAGVVVAKKVK